MMCRTLFVSLAVFTLFSVFGCGENADSKGDGLEWRVDEVASLGDVPPAVQAPAKMPELTPPPEPKPPEPKPKQNKLPNASSFEGMWAMGHGWRGKQRGDYYTFKADGTLDVVRIKLDMWSYGDQPYLFKQCHSKGACPLKGDCSIGGRWEWIGTSVTSRGAEMRTLKTGLLCEGGVVGSVQTEWEKLPDENVWKLWNVTFPSGAHAVIDTARAPFFLMPCTDTNVPCLSEPIGE